VTDHATHLPESQSLDLDAIASALDDVEAALARLENGTYFVDELTGLTMDPAVRAAQPTARHA